MTLAVTAGELEVGLIALGLVAIGLSALARLAQRVGITAVPLYLLAGLAFGRGGIVDLGVTEEFVEFGAEIGVLLLLFSLGLAYSHAEFVTGLRGGLVPGLVDAVTNFVPGFGIGLLLGWELPAAVLLGGVTWVSSSGIISKVLADLGRLGNRETPAILNLLVLEDVAMAVYLPIAAALVSGEDALATMLPALAALVGLGVVVWLSGRFSERLSDLLAGGSDEALLLAVFGLTLAVAGLAQRLEVSAAIGAFVVGLALSDRAQRRAHALISPLRDLFAAIFFVFFSFRIDPADLVDVAIPALVLSLVTVLTKLVTGWVAAGRIGVGTGGRVRAGAALIARGEFSIVIAALGVTLADGPDLGALAAAYVLVTAIVGPLVAKYARRPVSTPRPLGAPV